MILYMKNILSYLLLVSSIIAFNVKTADYSGYAKKDAQSFMNEVKQNRCLTITLSDSSSLVVNAQDIAKCYPCYKADFSDLPIERLISFCVVNNENNTILDDVYIPYTLLLKKRPINVFFQQSSAKQIFSIKNPHSDIVNLTKQMQVKIAQKIETECQEQRARELGACTFMAMFMKEVQEGLEQSLFAIEEYKQLIKTQEDRFDQEQERLTQRLKKEALEEKRKYETVKRAEIGQLQEDLKAGKNKATLLEEVLTIANKKILETEKELSYVTLQRNILLCLIPFFVAIVSWWHINHKATVS